MSTLEKRIAVLEERAQEDGYLGRLAEQKLRELGSTVDVSGMTDIDREEATLLLDEERAEGIRALARVHDPDIDHDVELPEPQRIYTEAALDLLAYSNIYWKGVRS